ncbi:N,N-dimethylformamidase beta subunit family domain-containing protein [Pseudomonas japonica]|uniref:N,N-dimethylformamidase beta subunit family domain-containing protein n=1 Tax=Pseudomonas japonica TaxID=256466 RepID=UPI0037F53A4E
MTQQSLARPRHAWSTPGWDSEKPCADGVAHELWCYTDKPSYHFGETVRVHLHSTVQQLELSVIRDGLQPRTAMVRNLHGDFRQQTPEDCYAKGCNWQVACDFVLDDNWQPGFYLLKLKAVVAGQVLETEHFFVLKAGMVKQKAAILLTTSTLAAYNDWGGANAYRGVPGSNDASPETSLLRPLGKGFLHIPEGAPRNSHAFTPPPGWVPHHEVYEWARANGYSRHYSDAFWATYERPFVVWAEAQGYAFDYLTQWDLHLEQGLLDDYSCLVIVGHDEYWSWEMRDELDRYLDNGGNLARFAGNFIWQVRLSEDASRQYCYRLPQLDPLCEENPERVTTFWEHPLINRPSAASLGLTGMGGCYARYGTTTPRSAGGFTVYRPEHWALAGTDLYYGDHFGGAPVCIASFEMDGVEYTFRRGLPYATGEDGAPQDLDIIAMAPAVLGADDHWNGQVPLGAPAWEVGELIEAAYDNDPPDYMKGKRYGSGMVACMRKGQGTVFNAGTCEWVNGLIHRDTFTETITRNVLNRFIHS